MSKILITGPFEKELDNLTRVAISRGHDYTRAHDMVSAFREIPASDAVMTTIRMPALEGSESTHIGEYILDTLSRPERIYDIGFEGIENRNFEKIREFYTLSADLHGQDPQQLQQILGSLQNAEQYENFTSTILHNTNMDLDAFKRRYESLIGGRQEALEHMRNDERWQILGMEVISEARKHNKPAMMLSMGSKTKFPAVYFPDQPVHDKMLEHNSEPQYWHIALDGLEAMMK